MPRTILIACTRCHEIEIYITARVKMTLAFWLWPYFENQQAPSGKTDNFKLAYLILKSLKGNQTSILETAGLPGFSTHRQFLGFAEDGLRKEKDIQWVRALRVKTPGWGQRSGKHGNNCNSNNRSLRPRQTEEHIQLWIRWEDGKIRKMRLISLGEVRDTQTLQASWDCFRQYV